MSDKEIRYRTRIKNNCIVISGPIAIRELNEKVRLFVKLFDQEPKLYFCNQILLKPCPITKRGMKTLHISIANGTLEMCPEKDAFQQISLSCEPIT